MRWIDVSAEAITSIDTTAESALHDVVPTVRAHGAEIVFARSKAPLREALDHSGLIDEIGRDHLYATVREAVDACVGAGDVERGGGASPGA